MAHDETHTEFNQLIERMAYPIESDALVDFVRQHGKGDGVVDLATTLPHRTYTDPDDVRAALLND